MTDAVLQEHPGIIRDAIENEDGTFNVLDVPIMPPIPEGVANAPEDIGQEWMQAAIDFGKMEADFGQHLGSLHVHHHESMQDYPEYAGKILLRRLGTTTLEGKTVPCLFADFLFVPASIIDRMERNELSYRSPEVYDWTVTRVDTVALLSTEPPHNRMPMLRIGNRVPKSSSGVSRFQDTAAFSAAFFAASPPPYAFAKEFPMPQPPVAKLADDDEKKKDAEMQDDGGGVDVAAIVKMISSGDIAVKDFAAIQEAMASISGAPGEELQDEPEDIEEEAETPVQLKDTPETVARLRAVEKRLDKRDKSDVVKDAVDDEVAKLRAAGWHVSEEDEADMTHWAGQGEEHFARFAAAFRRNNPKETANTLLEAEGRARQSEAPEVAKLAAKFSSVPEAHMKVRTLSAAYDRAVAKGWGLASTREEYIESAMRKEA